MGVNNPEEFNFILGMDWLAKHHTIVNCYTNEVIIDIMGQEKIVLVGERKIVPACLILAVTAFHFIRIGYEAYLANIVDTTKVSPRVEDVPVVKYYPNIFLDELQDYLYIEKLILGLRLFRKRHRYRLLHIEWHLQN